MSDIDYAKRQEEVRQWLQEKGKPDPKTWSYHQAEDGRYFYWVKENKRRYGELGCCEYCNKIYLQNIGKFCSEYCDKQYKGFENKMDANCQCAFCKKDLFRTRSQRKHSKHGNFFCSKKCRNEALKASSHDKKYREIFLPNFLPKKNIKKKCVNCHISEKALLQIHHIDSNRENNEENNLECLCVNHHAIRHLSENFKKDFNSLTNRELIPSINIFKTLKENSHLKKEVIVEKEDIISPFQLPPSFFSLKKQIEIDVKGYFFVQGNRKRYGNKVTCLLCSSEYVKITKDTSLYCSTYCANKNNADKKSHQTNCSFCNILFKRPKNKIKSDLVFCSRKCQSEASKKGGILVKSHYNNEIYYRDAAFRHLPNKCADCDVCFEPILDVHHKDGNRENNDIENLEILCPNHHASRHMRQDENGEWVYNTKSLTPRDKLDEVKKALGI